jgi:hypothetical protein
MNIGKFKILKQKISESAAVTNYNHSDYRQVKINKHSALFYFQNFK